MEHRERPFLLFLCHPLMGHFTPVVRIASALRERGWAVSFLGSAFFRQRIEAAGLDFLPVLPGADLDDAKLFDKSTCVAGLEAVPSIIDSGHQTLPALPAQWESVKAALTALHTRDAGRQVVVVCEAFFYGALPLKHGAPLFDGLPPLCRPPTVCVSITAPAIRSVGVPPLGWPALYSVPDGWPAPSELPPSTIPPFCWPDAPPVGWPAPFDLSPEARERTRILWEAWERRVRPATELLDRKLAEAGAATGLGGASFMSGVNYTCHNAIVQIGLPEFEYPRSDFPPNFRFVGILPPATVAHLPVFDWWDELMTNSNLRSANPARKKVVVVAQGTVETDPTALIVPTMQVLANFPDKFMVIAILGSRGARLPATIAVPPNARVADYLSYDAVLPHADLWVHNGGYGAITHGIAHGVPMVIAGEGQDKAENARRAAYCGLGVDLACARPTQGDVGFAIDMVLLSDNSGRFREVAARMHRAAQEMDCFGLIEDEILKLVEC